ncbi:MAG: hypothetical protein HYU78_08550 [Rhodocyclales bacterium]|nr:hypothetical protein [Rhodocyclales bacterium]
MSRGGQAVLGVLAAAAMANGAIAEDVAGNSFLRETLRSIDEEVGAYRPILMSMGKDHRVGRDSREALDRIDALLGDARRLAKETRLAEAVRQGEQAKRLAIETMVRLKSGETVTHSLTFATPADECDYEMRRFESNVMLVNMNLEGLGDPRVRERVAAAMAVAEELKAEAIGLAATRRYLDAVKKMEVANGFLTRALQALGVPTF